MGFYLYHGPAGAGKTSQLVREFVKGLDSGSASYLIVPSERAKLLYEQELLHATSQSGLFIGNLVLTFEEFLIQLAKLNTTPVHLATDSMSRTIIRRLMSEKRYATFDQQAHYPGLVDTIKNTLIGLKKNGLTPRQAYSYLNPYMSAELEDLCQFFYDYQKVLSQAHYYDAGDLVMLTLTKLREGQLKIPDNLKALYIDRIFPLSLGQREIIKEWHQHFKQHDLKLAFTFDYQTSDDPYFYPCYTFLGEIADESEYFHQTQTKLTPKAYRFSDPVSEIEWAVQNIKKTWQSGVPLNQIGMVIPRHSFYQERIIYELTQQQIPFEGCSTQALNTYEAISTSDSDSLTKLFQSGHQQHLTDQLKALKAYQDFETKWEFEKDLFLKNFKDQNKIKTWKKEEFALSRFDIPQNQAGVHVCNLEQSVAFNFSHLFILGFTDSHYPQHFSESPFFTTEIYLKPEMREILEGPAYQLGKEKNLLEQVCARTTDSITLSYPQHQLDGRASAPSNFLPTDDATAINVTTAPTVARQDQNAAYPQQPKSSYSISELSTYLTCPYQYYARYQLKLGDRDDDDIDLKAQQKGLFLHHVMEKLFKQHMDLYRDAIEFDLYLNRLIEKTSDIIKTAETQNSYFYKNFETLKDSFCKRATQVISEYLKNEIHQIRDGIKLAQPQYIEWAFGKGQTPGLKIDTEDGTDLFVSGRIDRIDVDEKNKTFWVIDYKTGDLPSGLALKKGESLQLPLYLMAVSQLLTKQYQPAGGLFVGFKDLAKQSGLMITSNTSENLLGKNHQINSQEWDALNKTLHTKVNDTAQKIAAGKFDPAPQNRSACRFCDYRQICSFENKG